MNAVAILEKKLKDLTDIERHYRKEANAMARRIETLVSCSQSLIGQYAIVQRDDAGKLKFAGFAIDRLPTNRHRKSVEIGPKKYMAKQLEKYLLEQSDE